MPGAPRVAFIRGDFDFYLNRVSDGTSSIALCELCVAAMIFSESGNVSVPIPTARYLRHRALFAP